MKKVILSLFVLAVVQMAGFAQTYSFSGIITNNGNPVYNSHVCIMINPFVPEGDSICAQTDISGFYSFQDVTLSSPNDSVWLLILGCEFTWYQYHLDQLDGSTVNIDCGVLPGSDLIIGSQLVNEETFTWYFVSNMNDSVESYTWTIEGQTYTSPEVLHSFGSSGMHWVNLSVVNNGGEIFSSIVNIYVGEASANCQALFFQYGDSIQEGVMYFANSSLGSNLSYFWDFGDGNTSEEAYPTHTFADADETYVVCLTVSGDGCDETYCLLVDPQDDGSGMMPNGGDEAKINASSKSSGFDFVVIPLSSGPLSVTKTDVKFEMSLFPNPSTGNVNFQLDLETADNGIIQVTDLTGRTVYQQPVSVVSGAVIDMNFNQLSNGVYLVQFQGKMNSKVLKMAIQR